MLRCPFGAKLRAVVLCKPVFFLLVGGMEGAMSQNQSAVEVISADFTLLSCSHPGCTFVTPVTRDGLLQLVTPPLADIAKAGEVEVVALGHKDLVAAAVCRVHANGWPAAFDLAKGLKLLAREQRRALTALDVAELEKEIDFGAALRCQVCGLVQRAGALCLADWRVEHLRVFQKRLGRLPSEIELRRAAGCASCAAAARRKFEAGLGRGAQVRHFHVCPLNKTMETLVRLLQKEERATAAKAERDAARQAKSPPKAGASASRGKGTAVQKAAEQLRKEKLVDATHQASAPNPESSSARRRANRLAGNHQSVIHRHK